MGKNHGRLKERAGEGEGKGRRGMEKGGGGVADLARAIALSSPKKMTEVVGAPGTRGESGRRAPRRKQGGGGGV